MSDSSITDLIPHRPPFLWVDTIVELGEVKAETRKTIPQDLPFFEGHYPGNPIVPGVILCEAVFQTGALLMGNLIKNDPENEGKVPVLTRIENAKFKKIVRPGDTITITVNLKETVSSVSFFKGKLHVNGEVAVIVSFTCALT